MYPFYLSCDGQKFRALSLCGIPVVLLLSKGFEVTIYVRTFGFMIIMLIMLSEKKKLLKTLLTFIAINGDHVGNNDNNKYSIMLN